MTSQEKSKFSFRDGGSIKFECRYPIDIENVNSDFEVPASSSSTTTESTASRSGTIKYEIETTFSDDELKTLFEIKPSHDLDIDLM